MHYRVIEEKSKWQRWLGPALALVACLITAGLGLLWGVSVAQSQIQENVAMKEQVAELTATIRLLGKCAALVCLNETFLDPSVEEVFVEGFSLVARRDWDDGRVWRRGCVCTLRH